MRASTILLWIQGIYFTITGVWPFGHLASFIWVTGPKNDIWLLKTVSALILAIGLTYLTAAFKKEWNYAIAVLVLGGPIGLMAIDIYYATNNIIPDVYLLDAVAEALFILAWTWILWKGKIN